MAKNGSELLRRDEVAALAKVHNCTVKRWEDANLLNPVKINKRVIRYKIADVKRLLNLE